MRVGASPRRSPALWAFAAVATGLLVLLSSSVAGPASASPSQTRPTPRVVTLSLGSAPSLHSTAGTPVGLDPEQESPVPNAGSLEEQVRSLPPAPTGADGNGSSPLPGPPAPAASDPAELGVGTGWFTGRVANSSRPGDLLAGVFVAAVSDSAPSPCLDQDCGPGTTSTLGTFNVTCQAGADYVVASIALYAQNFTFATCLAGSSVAVGTILLVPDGYVTGRVVGDVPGSPALGGVTVVGETRGGSAIASPSAESSNTTGAFRVPVPPQLAGEVEFDPGLLSYLTNLTWVTVASGETVDLGTVYLEPTRVGTLEAEFVDAVTGDPITPLPNASISMELCLQLPSNASQAGSTCSPAGTSPTAFVNATGAVGESYVVAKAPGYLTNVTAVGYVDPGSASAPQCAPQQCRIELVPLGEISGEVGISGDLGRLFDGSAYEGARVALTWRSLAGYYTDAPCYVPEYCSRAGTSLLEAVVSVGTPFTVPAFPLWDTITANASWSFSTAPFAISNWTDVNVTPDEIAPLGSFNLTPGTYVQGEVYVAGTTGPPPGGFTVSAVSRINPGVTDPPWLGLTGAVGSSPCERSGGGPAPDASYFCVTAPPGPVEIDVTAPGYVANQTWVSIPYAVCCARSSGNGTIGPFNLSAVTAPSITSVNLTAVSVGTAVVSGSVVAAGTGVPIPYAGVEICATRGACSNTTANSAGAYLDSSAPSGWDSVLAAASGWVSNTEWFFVGQRVTAPPLPLEPEALLSGTVEVAGGAPAIGAVVTACALAASPGLSPCLLNFGPGVTNSEGQYEGYVTGGRLPEATYRVEAVAPGYAPDFVWANATAGQLTPLPTLVLDPVGSTDRPPLRSVAMAGAAATTWVVGRVIDPSTGHGVMAAQLTPCPVSPGSGCAPGPGGATNSGGFFNFSVAAGVYNVTVLAPGYLPDSVFVNATAPPLIDVGTVPLGPVDWVWGNVTLDPWPRVSVWQGSTRTPITMAPEATAMICSGGYLSCSAGLPGGTAGYPVATGGEFELPSSTGRGLSLVVLAVLCDVSSVAVNLTPGEHSLPRSAWPHPLLWTAVYGSVWDAASEVASGQYSNPAAWAVVDPTNDISNAQVAQTSGLASVFATTAGAFVSLVPSGGTTRTANVSVFDQNQFYPSYDPIRAVLGPPNGVTYGLPPIALLGYGWAEGTLVSSSTGAPITTGVRVSASFYNPSIPVAGTTFGLSNSGGFVNLSAPAGSAVLFTFQSAESFNGSSFREGVVAGQATVLSPNGSRSARVVLEPAGYLASAYVNYSAPASYTGTLFDPVANASIPNGLVSVASPDPLVGVDSSLPGNDLGEFFTLAPLGPSDLLEASAPGYGPAQLSPFRITPGNLTLAPWVNLTAEGVVAGRVVSAPGNASVPGATVEACPAASPANCEVATTNASGVYWVASAPGSLSISATAPGLVDNSSTVAVARSDGWTWAPTTELLGDSLVEGTVRGLPVGSPLAGANVSICSPLGTPIGPCEVSITTGPSGGFSLYSVPGSFVLAVSAPDFNTTYRPLGVPGGTVENLGNVLLEEDGVVTGEVESTVTAAPIPGANVYGCPLGSTGGCTPAVATNAQGVYRLLAPPGRLTLLCSAGGFDPATVFVTVPSGATVDVPPLALDPIPGPGPFTVTGQVVDEAAGGAGLAGAAVSLSVGSAPAASTETDSAGGFQLSVAGGSYLLSVVAPGFVPAAVPVVVTGDVAGLRVALEEWTWNVSLRLVDGLTQAPLVGAAIDGPGGVLGTADGEGAITLRLPNGTYPLIAGPPPTDPMLVSVDFDVGVDDGPVSRNVELFPPTSVLGGVVAAAATGELVPGALVTGSGTAVDGAVVGAATSSDGGGEFSLPLYEGNFTLTVSAVGYAPSTLHVQLQNGSASVQVALEPGPAAGAGPGAGAPPWVLDLGLALLAAAVATVAWSRRRGRAPPPPPAPEPAPAEFRWGDAAAEEPP